MVRSIDRRYVDPLDTLWLAAAAGIGLEVHRSDEVFASAEHRRLTIATGEHLDADDCLAQMIFHELCHSLVEGPESFEVRDWGLPLETDDPEREQACLRVQAHLAASVGLRRVLAPTTEFRAFYDRLGPDPLEPRDEASAQLAIAAIRRADRPPWSPHLRRALEATAQISAAVAAAVDPGELLLADADPVPPPHPSGLPGGWVAGRRCGDCAWREPEGRCLQGGVDVAAAYSACVRFEPALDCFACTACCRGGYDSVTVDADDPVVIAHPALIRDRGHYLELARTGDRCAALQPDHRCSIYADRPRCCRELEVGGEHCLTARRRVGLSL